MLLVCRRCVWLPKCSTIHHTINDRLMICLGHLRNDLVVDLDCSSVESNASAFCFEPVKAKCRSIRFNAATIKVDNEVVPQMTEANHQAIIDRMMDRRALWKPDATAAN